MNAEQACDHDHAKGVATRSQTLYFSGRDPTVSLNRFGHFLTDYDLTEQITYREDILTNNTYEPGSLQDPGRNSL